MNYKNHIEHYKKDAEFYDFFNQNNDIMGQEIRRRYEEFFHLYKYKQNDKILEIGAGGGYPLENIDLKKCEYIPIDISTFNLNNIRQKAADIIFPISADVYNLPFNSNSFDFILMSEVMEHLENPAKALMELFRVLKKNGSLIISVPYKEILSYQICIHCNKPTPTNAHLHSFDEEKLINLVSSIGFTPVKTSKHLNKIFNRLHWNQFMRNVPFVFWKFFNNIFNALIDKPNSIILLAKK